MIFDDRFSGISLDLDTTKSTNSLGVRATVRNDNRDTWRVGQLGTAVPVTCRSCDTYLAAGQVSRRLWSLRESPHALQRCNDCIMNRAHPIIATHILIKSVGVLHMRMTKAMRQTLNRDEKLVRSLKLSSYFYETASIKFHQAVVKWLHDHMSVAFISDSLGHDNRPTFSNCL